MPHAKTQEGTRNTGSKKSRRKVSKLRNEQITELSEIAKAIRGEAYSYPTDNDPSKGS